MFLIFLVDVLVFDLKLYLKHFNMFIFRSLSKERARNTLQTLVNSGDTDRMGVRVCLCQIGKWFLCGTNCSVLLYANIKRVIPYVYTVCNGISKG